MSDAFLMHKGILLLMWLVFLTWVFWRAVKKAQTESFYQDTPGLLWLGIYVWGDALILAPFWMVSGLVWTLLSPVMVIRYLVLFFLVRSAYEVVYWINHQVAQKNYRPPLFRRFGWIGANEAAILYQLLHTCQVALLLMALLATW